MPNSATQARTVASAAKGLIFAVSVLSLGTAPAFAGANIQMLPPVTEGTATVCPQGTPHMLTWDGGSSLACSNELTVLGSNVGIGTTVPAAALDVFAIGTGLPPNQPNSGGLTFRVEDGRGRPVIATYGNIDGNQLADDTATALAVFNVSGTGRSITTSSTIYAGNAAGRAPYNASIITQGNVGIGTTAPQATLDVNGAIKLGSASSLIGAACSPVGAIEYDQTTDAPVYCSSATSTWKAMGAQQRVWYSESYALSTCYPNPSPSGEAVISVIMNANGNGGDGDIQTGPDCNSLNYLAGYSGKTKGAWGYNFGVQAVIPTGWSFEIIGSNSSYQSAAALY